MNGTDEEEHITKKKKMINLVVLNRITKVNYLEKEITVALRNNGSRLSI